MTLDGLLPALGHATLWLTYAMVALIAVLFTLSACVSLWLSMHAWRSPVVHQEISQAQTGDAARPVSFSAIVPFRHEHESVVRATVMRLLAQDHDALHIVLSVGHDDPESIAIGSRLEREHPDRIVLSIDHSVPKNKPRQLNTALAQCTGEYIAIFDAESLTHPRLFSHAAVILSQTGCEVLQSGVQLVNHRTSWFSLRNCMEYFFWFRSRLHLHAQRGFIPLGGNTVFVRTALLKSSGGWDHTVLAEDCELGVRLSTHGVAVAVSYDPELVTREETPDTLWALIKQRSRWNQGFLQVFAKGQWRELPLRRQRVLAFYTLLQPYLQALTFAVLPFMLILGVTASLPLPLALLLFMPLFPMLVNLLFEMAALHEFGADLDLPVGLRDYALLAVSLMPYQFVLGYAALRAIRRHHQGETGWEKTAHSGHHLVAEPVPAGREVRAA